MTKPVDLYDGHYGQLGSDPQREVRKDTYGEDLGQAVSDRWRTARARRREQLVALEGEEKFDGLQQFLTAVHTLASERRLPRYVYLAVKPESKG